ncbi:MAG: zonular occludens toxin domain-containing protein [Syntrophorhabdales bacterium]|jgi:zona occludens toxin (predicted ATPase)
MITCYTGTPGGGKSYAAMCAVIDVLRKGRTVYTNIDGLDSENCRIAVAHVSGLDVSVIDDRLRYLRKEDVLHFWDLVSVGSVIVIDEVHKIWSSRTYASEGNKAFAEWCSTHRHNGHDVILITQALDKLDGHVRSLIEWTHRCRKVNFVGSMVKRSYLEYVYSEDDERNCLSRKRKTYNPVIFKCYKSYSAKDIKEKGIGKATNILKHPVFFAIPVVFCVMIYLLFFKSSIARGDILGAKAHVAKQEKVLHPTATADQKPVVLNHSEGGYFEGGRWVEAKKPEAEKGKAAETPKGGPGGPVSSPGSVARVEGPYVYQAPAKVVREGDTWRFIEQGTGREIGYVKWVSADGPPVPAARKDEDGGPGPDAPMDRGEGG